MSETGIYVRIGTDNVLLEDLDEIERILWLESLSENGLIRTVNRCCDVIEDFIVNYQHLQQENQQLKRNCNIGNENLNFYREEYKKYKSVLDEIRKYIDNENFVDENICMVESMAILKILDKVKE